MGRKIHLPNLEWENNDIKPNVNLYKKNIDNINGKYLF